MQRRSVYQDVFTKQTMLAGSGPVRIVSDAWLEVDVRPKVDAVEYENDDVATLGPSVEVPHLEPQAMGRSEFLDRVQLYFRAVEALQKTPDAVALFVAQAYPFVRSVVAEFDAFRVYTLPSPPPGTPPSPALVLCRCDTVEPKLYFLIQGLQ